MKNEAKPESNQDPQNEAPESDQGVDTLLGTDVLDDHQILFAIALHVVREGKITLEELAGMLEMAGEPTLIDEAAEVLDAERAVADGEEVPMDDPEIEELIKGIDDIEGT